MEDKLTVKQWRQLRGYTQQEFAKLVNMKFPTYHSKESGKREWKAKELREISSVLKISIESQLIY
jgi:transcriptional regulator with XRE-family HTH domain